MGYNREELLEICRDSVVHHTNWDNRDSYSSQVNVQSVYEGLSAGFDFEVKEEIHTLWVYFKNVDCSKLYDNSDGYLDISSREEYFEDCDPDYETEMFIGYGIEFKDGDGDNYGYLPTRERLDTTGSGNDWY